MIKIYIREYRKLIRRLRDEGYGSIRNLICATAQYWWTIVFDGGEE